MQTAGQAETDAARQGADRTLAVLGGCALVLNFLWFETLQRVALLDFASDSGARRDTTFLMAFLIGMGLMGTLGAIAPRRMEEHWLRRALWHAVLGCTMALALAYVPNGAVPPAIPLLIMSATGIVNIALLLANTTLLAYIADRRLMSCTVLAVFALRTACLYAFDAAPAELARLAAVALPLACGACTLAAARSVTAQEKRLFDAHVRLTSPTSSTMITLLVLASFIYAITASAMTFDYWQPGLFIGIPPSLLLLGAAAYLLVAYCTLVATRADFLMRFLPGLFVLLTANTVQSVINTHTPSAGEPFGTVFGLFTEVYCETYAWLLMLYAVRMLKFPPFRIVGLFIAIEAVTEGVLYAVGSPATSSALPTIIPTILLVVLALIWNMHQLYQMNATPPQTPCAECPLCMQAQSHQDARTDTATPTANQPSNAYRFLAARHGLSERETDVFMLLAQGHSRRYIGDELFISYGTVSTHTSRIYEKFGVHSKQELLTAVHDAKVPLAPESDQ